MVVCFMVTYSEDGKFFYKRCGTKREASNIARQSSKGGKTSRVFTAKGEFLNGTFVERETIFVAEYRDGKRR